MVWKKTVNQKDYMVWRNNKLSKQLGNKYKPKSQYFGYNDILTADDICKILHIKPNTLYSKRWRRGSKIPAYRQGKYLFSFKNEFWNWYKRRAVA